MERCVIFLANYIKHNEITVVVSETAQFVVLMQESYYLFQSNNTSLPYPKMGLALLCICELQELTFLQLIIFCTGGQNYVSNKCCKSDLCL